MLCSDVWLVFSDVHTEKTGYSEYDGIFAIKIVYI